MISLARQRPTAPTGSVEVHCARRRTTPLPAAAKRVPRCSPSTRDNTGQEAGLVGQLSPSVKGRAARLRTFGPTIPVPQREPLDVREG